MCDTDPRWEMGRWRVNGMGVTRDMALRNYVNAYYGVLTPPIGYSGACVRIPVASFPADNDIVQGTLFQHVFNETARGNEVRGSARKLTRLLPGTMNCSVRCHCPFARGPCRIANNKLPLIIRQLPPGALKKKNHRKSWKNATYSRTLFSNIIFNFSFMNSSNRSQKCKSRPVITHTLRKTYSNALWLNPLDTPTSHAYYCCEFKKNGATNMVSYNDARPI